MVEGTGEERHKDEEDEAGTRDEKEIKIRAGNVVGEETEIRAGE